MNMANMEQIKFIQYLEEIRTIIEDEIKSTRYLEEIRSIIDEETCMLDDDLIYGIRDGSRARWYSKNEEMD